MDTAISPSPLLFQRRFNPVFGLWSWDGIPVGDFIDRLFTAITVGIFSNISKGWSSQKSGSVSPEHTCVSMTYSDVPRNRAMIQNFAPLWSHKYDCGSEKWPILRYPSVTSSSVPLWSMLICTQHCSRRFDPRFFYQEWAQLWSGNL
jgi:hypothetical protein